MKPIKTSHIVGLAVSALYIFIAVIIFVAHLYSVDTNPADSGESAIPFYMLTLPWMLFIPNSWNYLPVWNWLVYPLSWLCIALNAILIFSAVNLGISFIQWLYNEILFIFRKI